MGTIHSHDFSRVRAYTVKEPLFTQPDLSACKFAIMFAVRLRGRHALNSHVSLVVSAEPMTLTTHFKLA